ncbi:MAG: cadherin domain-containing protein [Chloroflexi bacterium]|nr:cadherin domain-containing protein [Chloroflexota bacterium]
MLALLAVAALGLSLLLPGGVLQAQSDTIEYAENGKDPVATFTAEDPEGATPVAWDIVEGAGDPDGDGDLEATDNADAASFEIDEDGMLTFMDPPDFENPAATNASANTYKVVVVACDVALDGGACPDTGEAGYHPVTVMVTKVDEPGKVDLVTSTSGGTPQYLVGATLTATASDGDITQETQTFTADIAGEVTGVTWQWYRGRTEITGTDAEDNTYTLLDADVGQNIRVVVSYQVDGNTRRERVEETTDYPVLQVRAGDSKLKFDPATVSRTISEGAKDRNVGAPVTATDSHGTIRYALADSGDATTAAPKFEIDAETGQITTAVELNYESTDGAADNCASLNSCTVTVTAVDSTGEAAGTPATVNIAITDVDEKPGFNTGEKTVSVPENSTALFGAEADGYGADAETDVTYTAADPEGRTVSYSLAGPDASKFQLSGSPPVLSFVSKADFEAKASADGDNVYEVTIRASVGGDTGERMVRVTVGDVDEAPVIIAGGLVITGDSSVTVAEGETAVATYRAVGPDAASATWSLSGDDAGDFRISSAGVLTFRTAPDYEAPADADTDNVYEVTVTANDSENTPERDVRVIVTNIEEDGVVSFSSATPVVDVELTAMLEDPDVVDRATVAWQWALEQTDGTYEDITGATTASYTPVASDEGKRLQATATYDDGHDSDKSAMEATGPVASEPADPFDTNNDGQIDKSEVIAAINDYLFGDGSVTKDQVIEVINRYLFG